MSVVTNIKKLCEKNGTNLFQLENACGLGNGTIRRWDDSPPAFPKIIAVADYFGITVDDLIKEESNDAAT